VVKIPPLAAHLALVGQQIRQQYSPVPAALLDEFRTLLQSLQ
jgi:hypothetical protein